MATSMSGRERYRTNKQDMDWTEEQAHQNVRDEERTLSGLVGGRCWWSACSENRGEEPSWPLPAPPFSNAA